MRKEEEFAFRIVKKIHRTLHLPLLIVKKRHVDNIVRTNVILHNMLLQYDGLDTMGDLDDGYNEVNADSELIVQNDHTSELPSDDWLEAYIVAADVRVNFTYE